MGFIFLFLMFAIAAFFGTALLISRMIWESGIAIYHFFGWIWPWALLIFAIRVIIMLWPLIQKSYFSKPEPIKEKVAMSYEEEKAIERANYKPWYLNKN